jgi:protein gp37
MGETTHISWCDRTWSPWTGCAKVSPGCDGCYAAHLMDTRMGRVEWGEPGAGEGTRSLMSDAYWRKLGQWEREAVKTGVSPLVFPSLCDPFDTAVDPLWRRRFVQAIEATPHVTYLLLTKRIGNVRKLTDALRGERILPPNVWIGASFVNQDEWDRDWRKLRDAQQMHGLRISFASFEPLLGEIEFDGEWLPDWLIAGGETTQGAHAARPAHPDWFRAIRDAAARAGKTFHFKQWGEWTPGENVERQRGVVQTAAWLDGQFMLDSESLADTDGRIDDEPDLYRVGKEAAGRALDGVIHDARPDRLYAEYLGSGQP